MTKADLFKMLEGVGDDEQLYFVSSEYNIEDDSTWMAETQTEIVDVKFDGDGRDGLRDVYIVLEAESFM